jgi:hypothetical protein
MLAMDYAVLSYLEESGGTVPTIAIPARIFKGYIPEGETNMVDLGLIEHAGEFTTITARGRHILAGSSLICPLREV